MRSLWGKVGFTPNNFQLNLDGDEINDVIIKEDNRFSPKINRQEPLENEKSKNNDIVLTLSLTGEGVNLTRTFFSMPIMA